MASRSTNIQDYRTANIEDLKADRPLPCDIFLYFEQNKHLLLWQKKDYTFPPGGFEKYLSKGLKKVWIYGEDAEVFQAYLSPAVLDAIEIPTLEDKPSTPERIIEVNHERVPDPSEVPEITARYLLTLLRSAIYSDRQKRALVAKAVRIVLGKAASAKSLDDQAIENFKLQELVRELLSKINRDDRSPIHNVSQQIWKFSESEPSLTHSLNVASYSILIAMAFGKIDEELLSEIGSAALIHDVGLSQLPISLASLPWNVMTAQQKTTYQQHVPNNLELFSIFLSDLSARVLNLVEQSHERFDGIGYPHGRKAAEIHEAAQILSMADLFETIASGIWDGKPRTFSDAIDELEKRETDTGAYFKPESFSAITKWIRESKKVA
jgi:HD-GYP domain-containing protein (c-di-GMP phosphodiesterase class II)